MTEPTAESNPETRRGDPTPVDGTVEPAAPPAAKSPNEPAGTWQPPDFAAMQECLTLLARAVRQFHTYPRTSPLCIDAIDACRKALSTLSARDRLAFRVSPAQLVVDEIPTGGGTAVEHELARRLHRAQVAAVEIACAASPRDLAHFCVDLSAFGDAARSSVTFAEVLADHGVDTITVHTAHRPEVLDVGAPAASMRQLVEHERQRRQSLFASGGPVQHLYPPDKGWVRVDPSANYESFSLVDLAVLIDDPAEVAMALMRLTGDDAAAAANPTAAFEEKFTDLATIFSAVDPRLGRLLFSKLSRAVLELDPERRAKLLRRTVLPGLLDGKLDGSVLSDFPDVDLAEALCLLLDLETAAPEVLTTALDRLGLPPERRSALLPLLEEQLRKNASGERAGAYGHDHAIEKYARRLIEIGTDQGKNFAEYAAFDLSVTDQTRTTVAGMVVAIASTDSLAVSLETLFRLVRLEPNPDSVTTFMDRAIAILEAIERSQRWGLLAQWTARFRALAAALRTMRPDAADAIVAGLERFFTVARAVAVAERYKADGKSRALAHALVEGVGETAGKSFIAALEDPMTNASARPLVALMCDHADTFAPGLAERLPSSSGAARQAIGKVLGAAGAAYIVQIIALLGDEDEATGRDALRSLARIGSTQAAAAVAAQLDSKKAWARAAAEEALWHFPPAQASAQARKLLATREFVLRHPDLASRLIDRAAQAGATGLGPVLETLTPLRFRFWNPAVVRVAQKARQLLHP